MISSMVFREIKCSSIRVGGGNSYNAWIVSTAAGVFFICRTFFDVVNCFTVVNSCLTVISVQHFPAFVD
jgi:hypothetical protein